jgi:hypothetical protein
MLILKERRWNTIKETQQTDVPRYELCAVCDLEDAPDKLTCYTREEVITHIQEIHEGWALCKGCLELITTAESEQGKGWCGLCIILCLDCMDEDKYGPEAPLVWPSPRTDTEVTIPEPEDPGPPPLYIGIIPMPSLIAKMVSGVKRLFR